MMILYIAVGVIILFVAVVASRPGTSSTTRSTTISAPAEVVFGLVNDFHEWEDWSPWAKLDPNAKNTYSGPESGVGTSFAWSGSMKVGAGRMTIAESRPNQLIRINLEFLKPMRASNVAEFTFAPTSGGTKVTWSMTGKCSFMAKLFGMFIDCEKMCGGMFEKGLASMKSIAESTVKV